MLSWCEFNGERDSRRATGLVHMATVLLLTSLVSTIWVFVRRKHVSIVSQLLFLYIIAFGKNKGTNNPNDIKRQELCLEH